MPELQARRASRRGEAGSARVKTWVRVREKVCVRVYAHVNVCSGV